MFDFDRPARLLALCPAYRATPLHRHGPLWIKDEGDRMGLGAFKALGGVHAAAILLARARGVAPAEVHGTTGPEVLVCASAGNHGLSVATGARLFGARARVHLAGSVPEVFADRLRAKGADVVRSGATYEAALAAAQADPTPGAMLLADGAWPGHEGPPRLVMEGYLTIAAELAEQMPTPVERMYVQAGVGGLAAAMAAGSARWDHPPEIVVVEPEAAPCLRDSAAAGRPVTVEGPESAMGRLDCKAPSTLALEVLEARGVRYEVVSEVEAAAAVDHVADLGHRTTPSGAAGLACCLREGGAGLCLITEGPA
ncbi:pyridoxal-phosphate dependent enzyme [Jannaschia sp. Os4]|uniref:pyridoxal-phosphate dependent enzyme n=1 Tax=Jannaschia sp. Os4 TaxID=2807617 RepID=UPI00193A102C|nr:pyridoxal-phosphate dependent enzyme [Jannaschia sp. Os4]MBM2575642.1 pyridoxal-phosphate dependent enzyme [Jannaschia sp. Os4]